MVIFKLALATWLALSPTDKEGLMDALAKDASTHYQCQEFEITVISKGETAYFFFDCHKFFTGGENERENLSDLWKWRVQILYRVFHPPRFEKNLYL